MLELPENNRETLLVHQAIHVNIETGEFDYLIVCRKKKHCRNPLCNLYLTAKNQMVKGIS